MTKKRHDLHSTEFGLWLREQPEIDSGLGYVATNIDYLWQNYKTGEWLLLEEKRYGALPSISQRKQFGHLDAALQGTPGYRGFYVLTFERTSPADGRMWLCRLGKQGQEVTQEELVGFLRLE